MPVPAALKGRILEAEYRDARPSIRTPGLFSCLIVLMIVKLFVRAVLGYERVLK